jgi:tRNA A58 N-methylase Trm61
MSQSHGAIHLWDKILRSHQFSRILEFGTTHGVFSFYLKLWAMKLKADFYTFDRRPRKNRVFDIHKNFHAWDIFEHEAEIGAIINSQGQSIIFCDNGDKPREVQVFSRYMKPGDIIAVHDWMTEVFPEHIPKDLEPIYEKECQKEGMTKVFKKL